MIVAAPACVLHLDQAQRFLGRGHGRLAHLRCAAAPPRRRGTRCARRVSTSRRVLRSACARLGQPLLGGAHALARAEAGEQIDLGGDAEGPAVGVVRQLEVARVVAVAAHGVDARQVGGPLGLAPRARASPPGARRPPAPVGSRWRAPGPRRRSSAARGSGAPTSWRTSTGSPRPAGRAACAVRCATARRAFCARGPAPRAPPPAAPRARGRPT